MRRPLAIVLATLALALPGCVSSDSSRSDITEVHLFGLPVAINLDNVPGADAFSIRIYASTAQQPKGVSIRQGTLDIVLFDGTFPPNQPITGKPLRIWSFSPQQLKALANENRLGTGYEFTLPWVGTPPTRNRVTVFARYRPKSGNPVVSGPSAISLATR
jgi:hypothetical protein